MRIGNEKENINTINKLEIPKKFTIPFTTGKESLDILLKMIYLNLDISFNHSYFMTSCVILTTTNDFFN